MVEPALPDVDARTTFRFVNRLGRSRVVGHGWFAYLTAVSADGRRIAYSTGGARRTSVVRVADGRTVSRLFTGGGDVVALGRVRALVDVGGAHRVVDPAHRTGSRTTPTTRRTPPTSRPAGSRCSSGDTSLTYVGSFPRGSLAPWRLPDTERVARFSGTDRRVLTLGHRDRPADQQLHAAAAAQHPHRRRTTDVPRPPRPGAGPALGGRAGPSSPWSRPATGRRARSARRGCGARWRGRCERASRVFTLDARTGEQSPLVLAMQRTG